MSEQSHMRSTRFRTEREADWRQLETLIEKTETKGVPSLSLEEAQQLAILYRKTATGLSVARDISMDRNLLVYLENLVARAFLAVYAPQESLSGVISRFFTASGPQAMRRSAGAIGLAFLAMTMGFFIAFALFGSDPAWFYTFIPADLAGERGPGASTEALRATLFQSEAQLAGQLGMFAAFLFSHNTRVALFAFALGVFACIPSFLLTLYNGLIIGAFAGLFAERDLGYELFGWLSIHGVTELSAIIIAAGGGFRMGFATLFPGEYSRKDALRIASRDAAKLAIIAAIMLLAAGLLEGFARQLIQNTEMRLLVGWSIGGLWLSWFLLAGRKAQ
ncbi:MAG: stage II sporulation protein M [Maricaulis sp.]|uniref:stage II sporulation protein M n=1 Tax=Maricaulis sp. TaxID=1486257 RepID=UPI001B0A5AA0|nr:stage II sporulation protein M [Maricaulis sp.]MBO6729654.1 stage II sporulation protein M [Maricaulis sp.]MBO6846975.1 stage II sporulation protein M [Maricaulis sp.]MBO6876334.1 stage II sporulation protein M [Maricaulis sp.]